MDIKVDEKQFFLIVHSIKEQLVEATDKLEVIWNSDDCTARAVCFATGLFEDLLDDADLALSTLIACVEVDKNNRRRKKVLAEMKQNQQVLKKMRTDYQKIMDNASKSTAEAD